LTCVDKKTSIKHWQLPYLHALQREREPFQHSSLELNVTKCGRERTNLSSFEWDDLGVVGGADNRVICSDGATVASLTEELLTVGRSVSEVLPRLPCLTVVLGPLQGEHSRTWRVGHLDEDVGNVELLHSRHGTITNLTTRYGLRVRGTCGAI